MVINIMEGGRRTSWQECPGFDSWPEFTWVYMFSLVCVASLVSYHLMLIGNSKLPVGVNVSVRGRLSQLTSCQHITEPQEGQTTSHTPTGNWEWPVNLSRTKCKLHIAFRAPSCYKATMLTITPPCRPLMENAFVSFLKVCGELKMNDWNLWPQEKLLYEGQRHLVSLVSICFCL